MTRDAALAALRKEASVTIQVPAPGGAAAAIFLEVFPRRPKLVVFGGVHIAMALVPMAKSLGYHTTVADGRQAFVTRERFPEADELLVAWPEEAFRRVGLDAATYVCVLSHDPKFDEPALEIALRSPAPYIGAIGSRKTQAARRDRLLGQGFTAGRPDPPARPDRPRPRWAEPGRDRSRHHRRDDHGPVRWKRPGARGGVLIRACRAGRAVIGYQLSAVSAQGDDGNRSHLTASLSDDRCARRSGDTRFINMLSWAGDTFMADGRSRSDIRQGVTLEV